MQNQVEALQDHSNKTFATRNELADAEQRLSTAVTEAREVCQVGLQDLRNYASAEVRVAELQSTMEDRCRELQHSIFQDKQEIDLLSTGLKKSQRYVDETFVTKIEERMHITQVNNDLNDARGTLTAALESLEITSATKKDVKADYVETHKALNELQQTQMVNASGLRETAASLARLEDHCEQNLATRDYAYETAKTLAHQVANECDEKEEIAQLRREFEEERERLRQNVRQQQHTRKDLNDAIEELHATRIKCSDLDKCCRQTDRYLQDVDGREADHWELSQANTSKQKKTYTELEEFYKSLREDFLSHAAFQKSEGERLKHHSTQRYLEQMDTVIGLSQSVQKIEKNHGELNDSLKSIKLPVVQGRQA